jgi:hypothetical protein
MENVANRNRNRDRVAAPNDVVRPPANLNDRQQRSLPQHIAQQLANLAEWSGAALTGTGCVLAGGVGLRVAIESGLGATHSPAEKGYYCFAQYANGTRVEPQLTWEENLIGRTDDTVQNFPSGFTEGMRPACLRYGDWTPPHSLSESNWITLGGYAFSLGVFMFITCHFLREFSRHI